MTNEQKELLKNAKSKEEFLALAKEQGVELDLDALEDVSGGFFDGASLLKELVASQASTIDTTPRSEEKKKHSSRIV